MAKTKQQKETMLAQYVEWLGNSQAVFLVEYTGVTMKELDTLRLKAREAGGEFHVLKNTLAKKALEQAGYAVPGSYMDNSTAVGFAFTDVATFSKALTDSIKGMDAVKIKGGFMGAEVLNPAQVKALASLPPLPVVRAQLLGVIQAPAGKLVRTLAEPGRRMAFVVKAFSDKAAPAAA